MGVREKDEIKGMLLDKWLEDLRQERAPQPQPEMELLTPEEIGEVMQLARWYKASLYPSESQIDVDRLASRLLAVVMEERAASRSATAELVDTAPTFGALVRAARTHRQIDVRSLERALAVPEGTVHRLESGELSPCRVQVEKMAPLLRALQLASGRVIEVIRRSGTEWAKRVYGQPQTQLGRVDPHLSDEERRHLLADEGENELTRELADIEQYCQALAGRLA